jgi:hypothetical protein
VAARSVRAMDSDVSGSSNPGPDEGDSGAPEHGTNDPAEGGVEPGEGSSNPGPSGNDRSRPGHGSGKPGPKE